MRSFLTLAAALTLICSAGITSADTTSADTTSAGTTGAGTTGASDAARKKWAEDLKAFRLAFDGEWQIGSVKSTHALKAGQRLPEPGDKLKFEGEAFRQVLG